MKNTKICPKCRSNDVIMIKGKKADYGDNCILTGVFGYVPVNRYLCCSCGYSEEWVNIEDIPKIKKKYCK